MKRVLVLDANQRSALAVTRSLGNRGVPVYTAEETPTALAGCSRFSKQHSVYPSPGHCPDRFVDVIVNLVKKQQIDIVLPMTELTTTLLLEKQALLSGAVLPFPDMKTVDSLANKCLLMRLAESLNITIPRTWYADGSTALPLRLNELSYPVVLKPGKSWLLHHHQWIGTSVRFADNPLDAESIISSEPAFRAHPFLIQEYVAGHGAGIFALYDHGKPVALFAHRRLREKPPRGGVSVLSESTTLDPVLRSHTLSLLTRAGWHGIAMVEFKVSPDGTPYLMEVNTRFWGSLQLAIDAGVDFPYLLYQMTSGEQLDPVDDYKTGTRLRWLLGDLDSLYLTLRDRRFPFRTKAAAVGRFITPSPFRTRHEVDRWGDFGPAWYEVKQYARDILR